MTTLYSIIFTCTSAVHSFLLSRSLHRDPFDAKASSRHPSNLNSAYSVPALHLYPPSTPFWPYGTYPFSPRAQSISILTDSLYSPTLSFSQPCIANIFYNNNNNNNNNSPIPTISIRDTPTKLLKHVKGTALLKNSIIICIITITANNNNEASVHMAHHH